MPYGWHFAQSSRKFHQSTNQYFLNFDFFYLPRICEQSAGFKRQGFMNKLVSISGMSETEQQQDVVMKLDDVQGKAEDGKKEPVEESEGMEVKPIEDEENATPEVKEEVM